MRKVGNSSIIFDSVYLNETATIVGPKEYMGPLRYYYDHFYNNLDCNEDSWEKAEMRLQIDAINKVMEKLQIKEKDISVIFSGDLNNQIAVSSYVMRDFDVCHVGMYGACSTSVLSLINGSVYVDAGFSGYIGCLTSSHNATSERQFRYPTEYGGQKPDSLTSTTTGAGIGLISSKKSKVKIVSATIGKVTDVDLKDPLDLGRTMAPAAAFTLKDHLNDLNIEPDYYDLILTGDLSKYGSQVFIKGLKELNINLNNYNDCGLLVYDINNQDVFAGGSGCACCAIVMYSYVYKKLLNKELKRVLIIATGALMNPTMTSQKETIPSIAHAIALERVDV